MAFQDSDLTCNDFLGGKVAIYQPRKGYRAGIDPVLLAAFVPAKRGQSVLELGCGSGVASLCLAARVSGLSMIGVELQSDYAELAEKNAAKNDADLQIVHADVSELPADLRAKSFDHVLANPPYFLGENRSAASDAQREIALAGSTDLVTWVDCGVRRLAPKGFLTLILNAGRLPDVLSAFDGRVGSTIVQPIVSRVGRAANLIVVQTQKGARGGFRLASPIYLHEGPAHTKDQESYTQQISGVLRGGEKLDFTL